MLNVFFSGLQLQVSCHQTTPLFFWIEKTKTYVHFFMENDDTMPGVFPVTPCQDYHRLMSSVRPLLFTFAKCDSIDLPKILQASWASHVDILGRFVWVVWEIRLVIWVELRK